MNLSPLQKARYEYVPKLPGMLRNGIAEICVKDGEATSSVADQDNRDRLSQMDWQIAGIEYNCKNVGTACVFNPN